MSEMDQNGTEDNGRNPDGTFKKGHKISTLKPEFKSFRAMVNWEFERAFEKHMLPRLDEIIEKCIRVGDSTMMKFFLEKAAGKAEAIIDLKNSDGSLTENKKLDLLKLTPEEREQLRTINAKLANLDE